MPNSETITIEEATERLIDYRGKTPPKTDSGIRLITAKVVKGGRILEEPKEFISASFYDEWMRRGLPQKFDVLLTTEAPLGEVAVLRDSDRIALAQRIILLRAKPGRVDPLFLFYALQSDFGQGELKARASGTTVSGIKQSELRQVRIPIFRLSLQRRIAGILSAYDDLIENNLRRIRILEEMARSIYREWFVNFRSPGHEKVSIVDSALGPIPQGWEIRKLGELTAFLNRGLSPSYDDNGNSIVINQKCIREQRLSLEPARRQAKSIPPDKLVRFGDVLINSTGVGTLGRVAQVYQALGQCTVDTHITIVRPDRNTDADFFGCMLLGQQETFERLGTGATGQTELSRTSIAGVELAVPPIVIQRRFGEIAGPMRSAAITLAAQIHNLRRTRDLLLPRLLSGTVNVSPADLPDSPKSREEMPVELVGETRKRSDPVAISTQEFRLSKTAAKENSGNPLELGYEPQPAIDQTDRLEVLAVIRQVFNDGRSRSREHAIADVAHVLGYGRVGHRIQDVLHTDLLTAVRRGILENVRGDLQLLFRSIADYDRDFLKQQFLAAVGRSWVERDEAIQNFCRWMGFRRTGPTIDETARSLINGLLRENRIETEGPNLIRRSS